MSPASPRLPCWKEAPAIHMKRERRAILRSIGARHLSEASPAAPHQTHRCHLTIQLHPFQILDLSESCEMSLKQGLYISGWPFAVKDDIELAILLPVPCQCSNFKLALPCIQGKHSIKWAIKNQPSEIGILV